MDGVAEPPQLTSRIPMVRGNNDHAIVVQAFCFEVVKETSQALVNLAKFKGYPVVESIPMAPV